MRVNVDGLNDRVNSPRFSDENYYNAINQAIVSIVNERIEPIKQKKPHGFETSQRLRDELYTLIPPAVIGVPTDDPTNPTADYFIPYPVDYLYGLSIETVLDGNLVGAKPTTYGERPFLYRNPFKEPSEVTCYYIERSYGITVDVADDLVFSQYVLTYLKQPSTVSIANPSDQLTTGTTLKT